MVVDLNTALWQPILAGIVAGAGLMYAYMVRKIKNITADEAEKFAVSAYAKFADGTCTPEEFKALVNEFAKITKD